MQLLPTVPRARSHARDRTTLRPDLAHDSPTRRRKWAPSVCRQQVEVDSPRARRIGHQHWGHVHGNLAYSTSLSSTALFLISRRFC